MGIFGFDSIKDMFDGGGAGGSGDTFSTGSNKDYVASGGTNSSDTNFIDRVTNTASDVATKATSFFSGGGSSSSYDIKPGDTLSAIAAANNTTVDALMKANPSITDPNKIYAGSSLKLPGSTSTGSSASYSGGAGNSSGGSSSTVTGGAGDTAVDGGAGTDEVSNVAAAAERFAEIAAATGLAKSDAEIEAMLSDPNAFLAERGLTLSEVLPMINVDADGTQLDPSDPRYMTSDDINYVSSQIVAATVNVPNTAAIASVITDTSADRLNNPAYTVDAVQGTVSDAATVNAEDYTIDMAGAATGVNADGTVNATGVALNDYATQNISKLIDTSTTAGKLLAQTLGEGNYTDTKATILGQMKVISEEFKGADGQPVIPAWAQATSREISRTIAFKGMTGTAATAATANAMMEATIGIAEKEATFFQTLTIKNLDNRQESIINKANVLAKFDLANLSARETAAVQNARSFLEMDLKNLDNAQQAEMINVQNRVDAMFTDVAEENVNRRLNIQNDIDNRQFYDRLQLEAATFNADAINAVAEANANRADAAAQFNINRTMARDQYESSMAYNIDVSNAEWRRAVETTNTSMKFEAAATDVKAALDLTTEGMNRLWDRVDSQLDYIWRSTEADEQRDFELLLEEMRAAAAAASAKASSKGSIFGAILGGAAKIGAAWIASDIRLKTDIEYYDTMPNGVKVYTWKWNDEAKRIGADATPPFGVLAQEIQETHPDAVAVGDDGYLRVNYGMIQ